jgi:hypothetical protein
MMDADLKRHLLEQIAETHEHLSGLVEERLGSEELADVERYFAALGRVAVMLEDRGRNLRELAQELVADMGPLILSEL